MKIQKWMVLIFICLGFAYADYSPGSYQGESYPNVGTSTPSQNQSLFQWMMTQTQQASVIFNEVSNQNLKSSAVNFLTETDSANSSRPSYSLFNFSSASFGTQSGQGAWSDASAGDGSS